MERKYERDKDRENEWINKIEKSKTKPAKEREKENGKRKNKRIKDWERKQKRKRGERQREREWMHERENVADGCTREEFNECLTSCALHELQIHCVTDGS